jgi:hypothetical protein
MMSWARILWLICKCPSSVRWDRGEISDLSSLIEHHCHSDDWMAARGAADLCAAVRIALAGGGVAQ